MPPPLLLSAVILLTSTTYGIDYLDHLTTKNNNAYLNSGPNDAIYSLDGNTRIVMQSDGNLVLSSRVSSISDWTLNWQSDTYSSKASAFAIQLDGNMCIYTGGDCVWHCKIQII